VSSAVHGAVCLSTFATYSTNATRRLVGAEAPATLGLARRDRAGSRGASPRQRHAQQRDVDVDGSVYHPGNDGSRGSVVGKAGFLSPPPPECCSSRRFGCLNADSTLRARRPGHPLQHGRRRRRRDAVGVSFVRASRAESATSGCAGTARGHSLRSPRQRRGQTREGPAPQTAAAQTACWRAALHTRDC